MNEAQDAALSNPAVLVVSCDKYADLWPPFFALFRRHWPDCPYRAFLGSNTLCGDQSGVETITVGTDLSWTGNLRRMLGHVENDQVLLFLEDFLLLQPVNTAAVANLLAVAALHRLGCLRLAPRAYGASGSTPYAGIGELPRGSDYRVSTQVAVWKKSTLLELCREDWTAWQFEVFGSRSSDELREEFWSVRRPVIHYRHGVQRGKWLPEGLAICRSAGVEVDLTRRPRLAGREYGAYRWALLRSRLAMLLPGGLRKRFRAARYGEGGRTVPRGEVDRGSR